MKNQKKKKKQRDICCKAIKLNPLWNVEKVTPGNKECYDDGDDLGWTHERGGFLLSSINNNGCKSLG